MSKPKHERTLEETEAQAVLRNIRVSPRKLNLVAALIRGRSAQDAVATLSIDAARVEPVLAGWNGMRSKPDAASIDAVHQRLSVRGPFVLHVGALDPHKNFAASLSAFARLGS